MTKSEFFKYIFILLNLEQADRRKVTEEDRHRMRERVLQGINHNRSWLKLYATSRKIAGSNPNDMDFFILPNTSSRTMALGSTEK
jgi:hypothetical protein